MGKWVVKMVEKMGKDSRRAIAGMGRQK